jgi:hypothetical protein
MSGEAQLRQQITFLEMQLQKFEGVSVQILSLETKLQKQAKEFQLKLLEKDEKLALLQLQLSKSPKASPVAVDNDSNKLKESLQKYEAEISDLKTQLSQAQKRETEISDKLSHVAQYETEISDLKLQLSHASNHAAEISDLKLQLSRAQQREAEISAQLNSRKKEAGGAGGGDAELKRRVDLLEGLLHQRDQTIYELQGKLNTAASAGPAVPASDPKVVEQLSKLLEEKKSEVGKLRSEITRLEAENLNIRSVHVQNASKVLAEFEDLGKVEEKVAPAATQEMSETEEEYEEEIFVDDDTPEPVVSNLKVEEKKVEEETKVKDFEEDFFKKEKKTAITPAAAAGKPEEAKSAGSAWGDEDDDKMPPTLYGKLLWLAGYGRKKIKRADLTQDTSFVFDPVTKKWVDKKAKKTEPVKKVLPPSAAKIMKAEDKKSDEPHTFAPGEPVPPKNLTPRAEGTPTAGGGPPPRFGQGQAAKRPQYALVGQNLGFGGGTAGSGGATAPGRPRGRPRPPAPKPIQAGDVIPPPLELEPLPTEEKKENVISNSKDVTAPIVAAKKQKRITVKKKRKVQRPSRKHLAVAPAPSGAKPIVLSQRKPQASQNKSVLDSRVLNLLSDADSIVSNLASKKAHASPSSSQSKNAEFSVTVAFSRLFL